MMAIIWTIQAPNYMKTCWMNTKSFNPRGDCLGISVVSACPVNITQFLVLMVQLPYQHLGVLVRSSPRNGVMWMPDVVP